MAVGRGVFIEPLSLHPQLRTALIKLELAPSCTSLVAKVRFL